MCLFCAIFSCSFTSKVFKLPSLLFIILLNSNFSRSFSICLINVNICPSLYFLQGCFASSSDLFDQQARRNKRMHPKIYCWSFINNSIIFVSLIGTFSFIRNYDLLCTDIHLFISTDFEYLCIYLLITFEREIDFTAALQHRIKSCSLNLPSISLFGKPKFIFLCH